MRSVFLAMCVCCFLFASGQTGKVLLSGRLTNLPHVKTVALRTLSGLYPYTQTEVRNGQFALSYRLDAPILALLTFTADSALVRQHGVDDKVYNVPVFLEPGLMNVECADSLPAARITGSNAHDEYSRLMAIGAPIEQALQRLREQAADISLKRNEHLQRSIARRIDSLNSVYREEVFGRYLRRNAGGPLAQWAVSQYWHREGDPDQVLAFLINMPRSMRNSRYLRGLEDLATRMARSSIGSEAADFTLRDTMGRPVSLSSFRGRWVLVDFWASWCLPCRLQNSELVRAFNRYGKKNFTILGVALERQRSDRRYWMEAIHDDSLYWTQVSDFKFFDGPVVKQYGIGSIPFNLLIDPNGKIVARYLRGERLWAKLDEFLGE